eukprot:1996645-Pyramimonas_sp.AAC.1
MVVSLAETQPGELVAFLAARLQEVRAPLETQSYYFVTLGEWRPQARVTISSRLVLFHAAAGRHLWVAYVSHLGCGHANTCGLHACLALDRA